MAQTEIGEVAEPAGEGRGGSSTLPHKRNPILSVTAAATPEGYSTSRIRCRLLWWASTSGPRARGTPSGRPFLTPSPWQVGRRRGQGGNRRIGSLSGEDAGEPERHRRPAARGECHRSGEHLGRLEAHDLVEEASHRALEGGKPLRRGATIRTQTRRGLSEEEIDAALDPAHYLGSAGEFVDRALKLYREGEI